MFSIVAPKVRTAPFDHDGWLFELKYDGFRALADTVAGRLISRNGHRLAQYEAVLDLLPRGHVFDGELVVLDSGGRPLFEALLSGRGCPTYVAFDLLLANGVDLRPMPLKDRKVELARIGKLAQGWIALTSGVVGEGRALYRAVVEADLEGIVAKRLTDAYRPEWTRWHKILNRSYSGKRGRAEWFKSNQRPEPL